MLKKWTSDMMGGVVRQSYEAAPAPPAAGHKLPHFVRVRKVRKISFQSEGEKKWAWDSSELKQMF